MSLRFFAHTATSRHPNICGNFLFPSVCGRLAVVICHHTILGIYKSVFTLQQAKAKEKLVERFYTAIKKTDGLAAVVGTFLEV